MMAALVSKARLTTKLAAFRQASSTTCLALAPRALILVLTALIYRQLLRCLFIILSACILSWKARLKAASSILVPSESVMLE